MRLNRMVGAGLSLVMLVKVLSATLQLVSIVVMGAFLGVARLILWQQERKFSIRRRKKNKMETSKAY